MDIIHDVTQRGDVKSLQRILAANPVFPLADPKFTSFLRTPLHVAAMLDYVDFASVIVNTDPQLAMEVDSQGFTPLHLATSRCNVDMVKMLLNANTDACLVQEQDGRTPLHLAAMRNEVEVMELLIQCRPEAIHLVLPNTKETILHLCVKHNAFQAMEKLVDYLVTNRANLAYNPDTLSVNSVDSDGNTILHMAAQNKRMKMLKYLLGSSEIGVDVNIRNTTPGQLRALDMLDEYAMYSLGIGCYDYNTTREVGQQNATSSNTKWLKERLNTIMIVAALIAGIAFQAVINPPGGVFQEDSKIDSVKDPIMFTYYLNNVIGNHAMYGGFKSYYSHISIQKTATKGNTNTTPADDEIITYRANFVRDLLTAAKSSESLTRPVLPYMFQRLAHGIVLEENLWRNITSNYNATYGGGSGTGFSPYLILYAGTAIMAYTLPKAYESYILLNSLSLVVCGVTILLVTFDATKQRPSGGFATASVVYLEVLLAIAVACITISYTIVIATLGPPFYRYSTLNHKLLILWLGFMVMPIFAYFLVPRIPLPMLPKNGGLRQCALIPQFLKRLSYRINPRTKEYIWLVAKLLLVYIVFSGLLYV